MCGIFATITKNINPLVETQNERGRTNGMKSKHRGPDSTQETTYKCLDYDIFFMFHRLAINGQDQVSNQPFEINNIFMLVQIFSVYFMGDTLLPAFEHILLFQDNV